MDSEALKKLLVEACGKYGLKQLEEEIAALEASDIQTRVAFLGEFTAGKSTLVNALIKRPLLPTFEEPTNAAITEISKSDEDSATVLEEEDSGEMLTRQIDFADLGREVMTAGRKKKINVSLAKLDEYPDNILMVDTPGVGSINDIHEDVTFGYLPYVDLAFVVVNINQGGLTSTLKEFIRKIPREYIRNFYVLLNWSDTLTDNKASRILKNVEKECSSEFGSIEVHKISAKNALKERMGGITPESRGSGIDVVIKLIAKDVPKFKQEIEESRLVKELSKRGARLIALLKERLSLINLDTSEYQEKINALITDIEELDAELNRVKSELSMAKNKFVNEAKTIINGNLDVLAHKIAHDEPITVECESINREIKAALMSSISNLSDSIQENSDDKSAAIEAMVQAELATMKTLTDLSFDIATIALTIWLVPGAESGVEGAEAAAAGGVVGAQKAKKLAEETSKFAKFMGNLGKIIKDMNPVEKVKDAIEPTLLRQKLSSGFALQVVNRYDAIYSEYERDILTKLDETTIRPLRDKQDLLVKLKDERDSHVSDVEKERRQIKDDLVHIEMAINSKG